MNIPVVPGHSEDSCKWHPKSVRLRTRKSENFVLVCAICDYAHDGRGIPAEAFIRKPIP